MFRPNRIGTPIIHEVNETLNTAVWAPSVKAWDGNTWSANVINSAPVGDYGRTALCWVGAAVAVAANSRIAIAQQVSITPPLNGDVVGVELNGALGIECPADAVLIPFVGLSAAAGGVLLGSVSLISQPTMLTLGPQYNQQTPTASIVRHGQYQEQVTVSYQASAANLLHGFMLMTGDVAASITYVRAVMSVRQLNDQQNVGYRDTLR